MGAGSTDPQEIQAALDQLGEQLAGSSFRAALREDPTGAAAAAGISVDAITEGLLATLGQMSDQELQIVARVQESFKASFGNSARVCILF